MLSDPDRRRVQPEPQPAAQHQEAPDAGGGAGVHLQLPAEGRSPARGGVPAGPRPRARRKR